MGRDRNTKWFHNQASLRRKKNTLKGIQDSSGVWVKGDDNMGKVATNYFSSLFQTSNPRNEEIDLTVEGMQEKILDEQRTLLDKPLSRAEIDRAIKDMNPSNAPGPDGAHARFFQKYWNIIGNDVARICLEVLNFGKELGDINKTYITLIPKKQEPKRMEELRPSSLCKVTYKIIAKAIANRMKKVLESIISPTQTAFVLGRLISDNVVVGFEFIHAIRSRRKGKKGWAALKLDMSKAYD